MEYKNNLRQEYLNRSVMTAGPAELVVMLFDACIKNIKLAQMAMEGKPDFMRASGCLIKSQRIINELISSLDMSIELSAKLLPIYEFLLRELRDANVKKDLSQLSGVLEILSTQRDTWSELARTCHRPGEEVLCG